MEEIILDEGKVNTDPKGWACQECGIEAVVEELRFIGHRKYDGGEIMIVCQECKHLIE
ncbi:hypothetical protein [endosymbiont GvMRE of Glomus versiforme]|uniref:hypothetical protein n=1 Tax=endosymbiont GvMRE of Glomus versiforme TaxID=2039283 RepID=UPI000EE0C6E6|nr:hypothetical protein [endosymbiont GvMRE of Glomus versiforme]RHZ37413.1 hypothetical protein GvMRE_I1g426 [endosymbiont GvMRE of Glomus versiforme]